MISVVCASNLRPRVLAVRLARLMCTGLFLLASQLLVQATDPASAFDSANRLYEQGKFTEAITNYGAIIQSGQSSAPVYFNLGNAFFKGGQVGRAILAYRQAKALAPRDPDVLANLQFARNQVQGATLSSTTLGRWLGKLSLNEWTLASAAAVWLWLLLLIIPQWQPAFRVALRGWTLTVGIVAILVCVGFGARYGRLHFQPTAVVITTDAALRQSPFSESASTITLHDGAEVRVLDRKDDWLQVSTDPRRIGWIQQTQAVVVRTE